MKISEIQKKTSDLLTNVKYPRIGTIIGLQEEVGILAGLIMDIEIYDNSTKIINLGRDIANVFFSLIDVCNVYKIDLEIFSKKRLDEIENRINLWEKEHGEKLEEKRDKLN